VKLSIGQTAIDSTKTELIKRTNNLTGFCSLGWKNTYGAWGLFYGRGINIGSSLIEVRIGGGIKEGFVLGGGINFRLYNNKKWFESFIATDYSYNFPGTIRFDDEKAYQPFTSDQYNFTACQYLHSYVTNRFFISKDKFAALQLKTGYAFLINAVSVVPTSGPNVNYSKARQITDGGLMIGLDLVLYIKYFQDFKKTKA
jgi:hypothetical protein